MDWGIWLSAIFAGLGLIGAGVSYHTRFTFGALRERLQEAERQLRELPDRYARRDDLDKGMKEVKGALSEIFAELRRANEGIAALRPAVGRSRLPAGEGRGESE
ncbi:MAG: hypothetical protein A3F84_10405 [Candidatus Handelsmanbacteria bacterium RIFCSPLOWO2_12_FULL_64_10]|uniref:DUF2730 family protein n=1 Tax=Handelsmanbacteria sp. (strain RIFCSPLOWO2_12_FULL_64_10) TaxID=1817868 RepID=A0A1F6CAG5_HANXR|nr:MAG: hypothetical protein A3F84_10405 [Candidatus Handelsmanbacteria bacterium RIFCSPLOWO2_12_FULL_64_10]